MTEYEIGEMMHAQSNQMWQAGQMYFTLVSAYLVVSYLAGLRLTRQQAGVITTLYVVWVATIVSGQISAGLNYQRLETELMDLGSILVYADSTPTPFALFSFLTVQVVGVLASLWFMWSVRHPKTE